MSRQKHWTVYALLDPLPLATAGEVRYVGCTSTTITERLDNHRYEAVDMKRPHWRSLKNMWLRALLENGLRPGHLTLETGLNAGTWEGAERTWIAFHREAGADLVNSTDGGAGAPGLVLSEEQRARKCEAMLASWEDREQTQKQRDSFVTARSADDEARRAPLLAEIDRLGVINLYETAAQLGKDYGAVYSMCSRLVALGILTKVGRGFYSRSYVPPEQLPPRPTPPRRPMPAPVRQIILGALAEGPRGVVQIAEATGKSVETVCTTIGNLCRMGKVVRVRRGTYALAA